MLGKAQAATDVFVAPAFRSVHSGQPHPLASDDQGSEECKGHDERSHRHQLPRFEGGA